MSPPTEPVHRAARTVCGVVLLLAAAGGCETVRTAFVPPPTAATAEPARAAGPGAARKPGKHYLRVGQYVFYSDVPLEPADPVFREVEGLPDQLQAELRLPPGSQLIQVYLFEDQGRYEAYMKDRFPWLPVRRAYFIADPKRPGAADELQVFTFIGEHLRTDLRHELTHAVLHGVLKDVPLWLDEGLAGVFEQPAGNAGVNPGHLRTLAGSPFQPDLGRLEKLGQVKQMEKAEYREAWAWVHYLLKDPRAKPVLLEYVAALRDDPNPGPLLPRLTAAVPDPAQGVAEHLAGLARADAAARPVVGASHLR